MIITDPPFVHCFGHDNNCKNTLCHEYRGSFNRHRTVERILVFLRERILLGIIGDAFPLYELLHSFIGIFFGFNCSFPKKDIALYTIWYLKGCKPQSVKEETTGE